MTTKEIKEFINEVCDYLDPENKYPRPKFRFLYWGASGGFLHELNWIFLHPAEEICLFPHILAHECMHWLQYHTGMLLGVPAGCNPTKKQLWFWDGERWWGEVYKEYPWEIEAEAFAYEYISHRSRLITKGAA